MAAPGHAEQEVGKVRFWLSREKWVAALVRHAGRRVERMPYTCWFDLLVDGKYKVEVKASEFSPEDLCWRFNLHRHGKMGKRPDFYVFRLEKIPFSYAAVHMIWPGDETRATISFTLRGLVNGIAHERIEAFKAFLKGKNGIGRRMVSDGPRRAKPSTFLAGGLEELEAAR